MGIRRNLIFRRLFTISVLACTSAAWGLSDGKTAQGLAYLSGGVSAEELAVLNTKLHGFSLWVVTAAKTSGAHLADVQVRILNEKRQVVFDAPLDGPWLLIDLPLGGYQVEAIFKGETQKRSTTIHRGDRHQIFFYFNTGDEVLPNGKSELGGIPQRGGKN